MATLKQACFQAEPGSAMCVRSFDDSLSSAIHITYRISLRSSSLWEPRHPSLKVVSRLCLLLISSLKGRPGRSLRPVQQPNSGLLVCSTWFGDRSPSQQVGIEPLAPTRPHRWELAERQMCVCVYVAPRPAEGAASSQCVILLRGRRRGSGSQPAANGPQPEEVLDWKGRRARGRAAPPVW